MIQDRGQGKVSFVDAFYLHTTFLPRGRERSDDRNVPKRINKFKYEIGKKIPSDFFYPEVFFTPRPGNIASPWQTMNWGYKLRALVETPLKRIKRKVVYGKTGY